MVTNSDSGFSFSYLLSLAPFSDNIHILFNDKQTIYKWQHGKTTHSYTKFLVQSTRKQIFRADVTTSFSFGTMWFILNDTDEKWYSMGYFQIKSRCCSKTILLLLLCIAICLPLDCIYLWLILGIPTGFKKMFFSSNRANILRKLFFFPCHFCVFFFVL